MIGMTTRNGIVFTGEQADGAIPNGTRVIKVNSEPGDGNPDGSRGTVVGSIAMPDDFRATVPPEFRDIEHVYFVKWDSHPDLPVFRIGPKVARTN